ncbi:MAG: tyrosine-type recombinase/integrase [Allorhizobium sp.]
MAAKVRHLLHRNGRYYARIRVPDALREIVGKRELTQALDADRTLALRLLPSAVHRIQIALDEARDRLAALGPTKPSPRRPLSLPQMAMAHFGREMDRDEALRGTVGAYDKDGERLFRPTYQLALKRAASDPAISNDKLAALIQWAVDEFAIAGNSVPARGSDQWRALARSLAGVKAETLENQSRRDRGEPERAPQHPLLRPVAELPSTQADPLRIRMIGPDSAKALSAILAAFAKEKQAKPGTEYEYGVAVRMFEEFLGEAKPAYRITRQDVLAYKNALLDTPTNYSKRFLGKPLPDAIKANSARKTPFSTLSRTTINDKWLPRLSSLLSWCVSNEIIPDNPATGIKVDSAKGSTGATRDPFGEDDLKKIFDKPLFKQGVTLTERHWTLLIALYSGMRASEIAQLRLDSIRRERGVLVFAIEEETKNKQSRRLTPVHSVLLTLGLEQRIATLRCAGATHMFPRWFAEGQGRIAAVGGTKRVVNQPYSQYIPRWFNRTLLPNVGIVSQTKVFHSFRHTFKTAMARAGVARPISDEITGHDDASSGASYIHETSIEAALIAVNKVEYDIPWLKAA